MLIVGCRHKKSNSGPFIHSPPFCLSQTLTHKHKLICPRLLFLERTLKSMCFTQTPDVSLMREYYKKVNLLTLPDLFPFMNSCDSGEQKDDFLHVLQHLLKSFNYVIIQLNVDVFMMLKLMNITVSLVHAAC